MSFGPNFIGSAQAVPATRLVVRSTSRALRSPRTIKTDTFVGRPGVGLDSAQAYPLDAPLIVPPPITDLPLFGQRRRVSPSRPRSPRFDMVVTSHALSVCRRFTRARRVLRNSGR